MFFKKKTDYGRIFSSATETHRYLYADRSKTSSILGDKAFIDAWLSSPNNNDVTDIISQEALNDDIPSIKQMIWLSELNYQNAELIDPDKIRQEAIKKMSLQGCVFFCEKAIQLGMLDRAYQAMAASFRLYSQLATYSISLEDIEMRNALNDALKYAKLFLVSGNDDPGLIEDAQNTIAYLQNMADLANAVNKG